MKETVYYCDVCGNQYKRYSNYTNFEDATVTVEKHFCTNTSTGCTNSSTYDICGNCMKRIFALKEQIESEAEKVN